MTLLSRQNSQHAYGARCRGLEQLHAGRGKPTDAIRQAFDKSTEETPPISVSVYGDVASKSCE